MVTAPMGKGETILVVDDEEMLLSLLQQGLESIGYKVITAKDGEEAFEIIKKGIHFDLLLTDIMMPGAIDGFHLANILRSIDPNKPVVYISAYIGLTFDEPEMVDAPLIQKPATKAEIGAVIGSALGHKAA
ncbi:response regulator [Shimia ponticola]|uniref:response regulator n=1 Tax=Shimia ponticola TaxID=2582893 RepID=UPI0011BF9141|nr:response regulator [Shimia ponticola]